MNGVHDMGGMHGFDPVEPEANEPVFHHRWEARTHAIAKALGSWGKWNIDYGRHQRELIPTSRSNSCANTRRERSPAPPV
jgi:hypothetical protein